MVFHWVNNNNINLFFKFCPFHHIKISVLLYNKIVIFFEGEGICRNSCNFFQIATDISNSKISVYMSDQIWFSTHCPDPHPIKVPLLTVFFSQDNFLLMDGIVDQTNRLHFQFLLIFAPGVPPHQHLISALHKRMEDFLAYLTPDLHFLQLIRHKEMISDSFICF